MGTMIGMVCHVFPGTKPSEYMKIPDSPRAMNFDGRLAVKILKSLNPNPDAVTDKDAAQDGNLAKSRVNVARSKIDKRDPYVKAAIKRRDLSL